MTGITNPTEEYFKDGGWGWDGTRWRKDNLKWGYYDRLADQQANADCPAGDVTLTHPAVPAGQVWVITGSSVYASYVVGNDYLRVNFGGTGMLVYYWNYAAAGIYMASAPLNLVLKAADYAYNVFAAAPLHAVVVSNIWGYKMLVA